MKPHETDYSKGPHNRANPIKFDQNFGAISDFKSNRVFLDEKTNTWGYKSSGGKKKTGFPTRLAAIAAIKE
jgi:hypothetical protein